MNTRIFNPIRRNSCRRCPGSWRRGAAPAVLPWAVLLWAVLLWAVPPASSAWAQAAGERPRLAVLPFGATGAIESSEVEAFTDQLRSDLSATGKYTVLPRAETDAAAKRVAPQEAITDPARATQAGKALRARYVVTGRILSIRESFQVTVEMTDVESGQVARRENARRQDDLMGLLTVDMKAIAQKLAGETPTAGNSTPPPAAGETLDKTVSISMLDLADGAIGVTFDTRIDENILAGFSFYSYSDDYLQITILNPHVGYATREQVSIMGKIGLAIGSATVDPGTSYETSGSGVGIIIIGGVRASLDRVIIDVAFRTISIEGLAQTDPYIAFGVAF